ncbi:MBL fold metallo-hydrolase [Brevibacterium litoralis]|uniref:MBL fold metallo-hydrolase n=1 Tax=Brevibacterium litoralis TaxID=3138935 RepID=UPI0032EB97D2
MSTLRALACGATHHDMAALLTDRPHERRRFPAGVFLYETGTRRILFDTGYAPAPWRAGPAAAAYRRLLPPVVGPTDTLDVRLRTIGVEPDSITHVVLSHLHPDHIGGLRYVAQAEVLMSAGTYGSLRAPRLREGVFRKLWPAGLVPRVVTTWEPGPPGFDVHDLLGDGSYLLLDLPGHTRGHTGALVEGRVLLAGDASWGNDLLGCEDRIRAVPRAITHDHAALTATARRLREVEATGVRVLLSHDPHPEGVDLLTEETA